MEGKLHYGVSVGLVIYMQPYMFVYINGATPPPFDITGK